MPWIIGIDEAGYGPNLGPLVMTAVACRVPDERADADLWHLLHTVVRSPADPADHRPLVADSKVVYSPARGLAALETGVLTTASPGGVAATLSLGKYLQWLCPTSCVEVGREVWFTGRSRLPVAAATADCAAAAARFAAACAAQQFTWGPVRSVVVCPARFNDLLARWGSKAAVLAHGLAELVQAVRVQADGTDALTFVIDKHGGRNTYTAMLQHAWPDGLVVACEEGRQRSVYAVLGLERDVRITFQPRADASHFGVALASMVSKYLRELLMGEFNAFWQEQVPGLKPTAGYPTDAARFFAAIAPACRRLGIAEPSVWRRK